MLESSTLTKFSYSLSWKTALLISHSWSAIVPIPTTFGLSPCSAWYTAIPFSPYIISYKLSSQHSSSSPPVGPVDPVTPVAPVGPVGPEFVIKRLSDVKMQTDYGASSISQWILTEFFESSLYDKYLITLRKELKIRRDNALDGLNKYFSDIAT